MKMKKLIVVIPSYNEEEILEKNTIEVYNFLKKNIKDYRWRIIISDNCSLDRTLDLAKRLSKRYKNISYVHMNKRSKSLAIKKIWLAEEADVYMYMDADLSTDLKHIPDLLLGIEKGNDLVTGSRTSEESKTSRNFNRHIISLALILMLKILFSTSLSDFQCGFKAINKKIRNNILPKMKATEHGFMDAEMLIVAHKKGYKVLEVPVIWQDERESRIKVFAGIFDALKNMLKIKYDLITGGYNDR